MTLSAHCLRAKLATEFLLCIYLIIPISASTNWYTGFRDYIFPRVLTPDVIPNLVLIIMADSSENASNQEWLGEEGIEDDTEGSDSIMEEQEDKDNTATT